MNNIYSLVSVDKNISEEILKELKLNIMSERINNSFISWNKKMKIKSFFRRKQYKKIFNIIKKYNIKELDKINVVLSLMENNNEIINNDFAYELDEFNQDIYILTNDLSKALKYSKEVILVSNNKIKKISKDEFEKIRIIKLKALNIKNVDLSLKGIKILNFDDENLEFTYCGGFNDLLNYLNKFSLEELLIEKINTVDAFNIFFKN